jgi:hypothetical protein
MGKKRTDSSITKVDGVDPEFLGKYVEDDHSLDSLKEHRTVPRMKIIQSTTDKDLKKQFGEGSAILRPGDVLICKHEDEDETLNMFRVVPIFFFVEFAKWADIKAKTGPMVEERSFDPTSILATNARDVKKRYEIYPGQEGLEEKEQCRYRFVEHLRFISLIYGDHPLVGTPVTLSFERGEFTQGKNFISAISLRRQAIGGKSAPVPLWAQVWDISTIFHDPSKDRRWYGFQFEPADPSIIQPEEAEGMRALHLEMKELFEKQRLTVQDEVQDEPTVADSKEF